MFSNIKTSKANKELVTWLTQKLNLGAENIIARIAFSYSISLERPQNLILIKDSGGKEYSFKVLFGDYADYYIALVCVQYNLHRSDKDLGRYIKMHIDDGLEIIAKELKENTNLAGIDFLISKIDVNLV